MSPSQNYERLKIEGSHKVQPSTQTQICDKYESSKKIL